MLLRDPIMGGTQSINSSLTSIPGLERSRSTCLMACLLIPPCAKASPWPMVLTAKDALIITPTVAFVSDSTRFACRPSPNNLSTNPLAYLSSAAPMRTTIGISSAASRADSYTVNQYSTLSGRSCRSSPSIGGFRFFSERFSAFLILLLLKTPENEGMLEPAVRIFVGPKIVALRYQAAIRQKAEATLA